MHTISYSTQHSSSSYAATNFRTQESHVASQLKRITFTTANFILDGLPQAIVKSEHDLSAGRIARERINYAIKKLSVVDGFKEKALEALKIIDKNIEKNIEINKKRGYVESIDIKSYRKIKY
jgi:hypothetical protein